MSTLVPRLEGLHDRNVSRVPKRQRLQGFQGIEGFPLLAGAFKKFGVSKIQGFQGKYIKYELGKKISSYVHSEILL